MFYYSDAFIDRLLLDDIEHGDLTTRALGFGHRDGEMVFKRKHAGKISGSTLGAKVLAKLGLNVTLIKEDGSVAEEGEVILAAQGRAEQLHQGWKVVQNILEWSCGVTEYMSELVQSAHRVNPQVQVACTRKSIPGTKTFAIPAVIYGGGILHRAGTAETVLLFANHRRFYSEPENWAKQIAQLRTQAPEKKIIVEADTVDEALIILRAQPDILQLDKFSLKDVSFIVGQAKQLGGECIISVAGGINHQNIADYTKAGAGLIVTSAPYYAHPADIKVILKPQA